nr:hypothetical protein CPGR_01298 [Mycolicibacter nonchromogenicus]
MLDRLLLMEVHAVQLGSLMMIETGPVSSALAMPDAAALRLEDEPSSDPLPGSPPSSTTPTSTSATTASTTTAANPHFRLLFCRGASASP